MWIRSQEKILIQKVDNMFISKNLVCTEDTVSKITLGTYKTNERAIEVLDQIHQHINNVAFAECHGEAFAKVYTMPEKQ